MQKGTNHQETKYIKQNYLKQNLLTVTYSHSLPICSSPAVHLKCRDIMKKYFANETFKQ